MSRITLIYCFFLTVSISPLITSCGLHGSTEANHIEQAIWLDVVAQREEERTYLHYALEQTTDPMCRQVYRSMLAYHEASDSLFSFATQNNAIRVDNTENDLHVENNEMEEYWMALSEEDMVEFIYEEMATTMGLYADLLHGELSENRMGVLLAVLPAITEQCRDLNELKHYMANLEGDRVDDAVQLATTKN